MTSTKTKRLTPIIFIVMGLVFAYLGFNEFGFWSEVDGPLPGFFPSIMAIVMVFAGIMSLIQSFKDTKAAEYNGPELLVVAGGIGIFVSTFIIGLVPTIFLYIILWLKLYEKAPWKPTLVVLGVAAAITIGVFGMWLGIQFPMGVFENIL